MFDFAWSEIALIAAVALIAIGPKDMPVAIRAVTDVIKKARRMAGEFQTHVDEMMRDANLDEVRSSINEIRNFDIRGQIERTVDPDGSLRDTFACNPLEPTPTVTETIAAEPLAVSELPSPNWSVHPTCRRSPKPRARPRSFRRTWCHRPNARPPRKSAPAFIPPEVVQERRSRQSSDHWRLTTEN